MKDSQTFLDYKLKKITQHTKSTLKHLCIQYTEDTGGCVSHLSLFYTHLSLFYILSSTEFKRKLTSDFHGTPLITVTHTGLMKLSAWQSKRHSLHSFLICGTSGISNSDGDKVGGGSSARHGVHCTGVTPTHLLEWRLLEWHPLEWLEWDCSTW